jgi:hypothetical protein
MPKLLDLLKTLSTRINSDELTAAVGASEPWNVEIEEENFTALDGQVKNLLTFESAINSPRVLTELKGKVEDAYKQQTKDVLRKEILSDAERKLEPLGKKFGVDLSGKKIDEIVSSLDGVKLEKADNKEYETLQTEFGEYKKSKENEIKALNQSFTDFKIDEKLKSIINGVKISEPYQEQTVKDALTDKVIQRVRSQAVIQLTDTGALDFRNPKDPNLELFGDDNKKLGAEDLINPLMQPYIQATKPKESAPKRAGAASEVDAGANPMSANELIQAQRQSGVMY